MTENEKRLRESLGPSMLHHLEMLLAEKAEEKRAARAEALQDVVDAFGTWKDSEPADVVRRMMTAPALASIPVERVREEARRLINIHLTSESERRAVATLADACGANVDDLMPHEWIGGLGVPLDVAQETKCSHGEVGPEHCRKCSLSKVTP